MRIESADGKKIVNIGGSDIWHSVYSTVVSLLGRTVKKVPLAIAFMEQGSCDFENAIETARQFNLIRDELSKFSPEKAVYDIDNKKAVAPWKGKISPVVTSCANLYTTADGDDLLYEVVKILCYGNAKKITIEVN